MDIAEKLLVKEAEELSKEELLEQAIELGLKFEQIVCPLCALNRVVERTSKKSIEKGKEGRVRFDNFDFDNGIMLQMRYALPRKGFFINPEESLTFEQVIKDPAYSDFVEQIKETCIQILTRLNK